MLEEYQLIRLLRLQIDHLQSQEMPIFLVMCSHVPLFDSFCGIHFLHTKVNKIVTIYNKSTFVVYFYNRLQLFLAKISLHFANDFMKVLSISANVTIT